MFHIMLKYFKVKVNDCKHYLVLKNLSDLL